MKEHVATERMLLCRQMNQELVAERDGQDLDLLPRVLAQQAREDAMTGRHLTAGDKHQVTSDHGFDIKLASAQSY